MSEYQLEDWAGSRLGEIVAVCLYRPMSATGADILPHLVCTVPGDPNQHLLVLPHQLGAFLASHRESILVTHDVATMHWKLLDYFRASNNRSDIETLWSLSRQNRLHDVILLDQRIEMICRNHFPLPRKLSQIVDFSVEAVGGFITDLDHGGRIGNVLLQEYGELCRLARRIAGALFISEEQIAQFGPLGHGFDVKAAIALVPAQERGFIVHPEAKEEILRRAHQIFQRASEQLYKDKDARRCFVWKEGIVQRDSKRNLKSYDDRLQDWLQTILGTLRDVHNARWTPPFDSKGRLSLVPSHWGILLRCDHRLRAWGDLIEASDAIRKLDAAADQPVRPSYAVVPDIQECRFPISFVRRLGPLFQPRPGYHFVRLFLKDLELRCYARLCELRYHRPDVYLAHLIRRGFDPVVKTAQELFSYRTDRAEGAGIEWFRMLETLEPEVFSYWIQLARILLLAIPLGLSDSQIREWLRNEMANSTFGEADVQKLRKLLRSLHNELDYLEDPTLETLARKFGKDSIDVFRRLCVDIAPGTTARAVRNVLDGRRPGSLVWGQLQGLTDLEHYLRLIEDEQDASVLLLDCPTTLSGRVDKPTFSTQRRAAEFMAMADEIRKDVAYELTAAGWHVCAITKDEIVIEFAEAEPNTEQEVRYLIESRLQEDLAGLGLGCASTSEVLIW